MSESGQNETAKLPQMRRGKVFYVANPSIVGSRFATRFITNKVTKTGSALMITPDTGQVLSEGCLGFIEEKEVDTATFVKVYLAGIKQYAQLSKAGAAIFEIVYKEISGLSGKDKDTVEINYYVAQEHITSLAKRTFERGLNELLSKEFLYRSVITDKYFVNVNFMFNGDRMVVVKAYRRAGSKSKLEPKLTLDINLPLDKTETSSPKTE